MCITGGVVACWSLTQEVAEWQVAVMRIFVTEFSENI